MKEVLSALVKQKGHSRGAMGLAAKLQADKELQRARIAELEAALARAGTMMIAAAHDIAFQGFHKLAHALREEAETARSSLASAQREGDRPVSPPDGRPRETIFNITEQTSEGGEG